MSKVYDRIDDGLARLISAQRLFFVATAPLDPGGHLNLSPKGLESFRVIDPHTVAYLDLTGSGVETIAHLRENGRIVLMFCTFEGPPKVLRLYGQGEPIEPGDPRFAGLQSRFPEQPGMRAIIVVALDRIAERAADVRRAYTPGSVPQYDDVATPAPSSTFTLDPLAVAAPNDTYFVAGEQGRRVYTRDGSFSLRAGVLVDATDRKSVV